MSRGCHPSCPCSHTSPVTSRTHPGSILPPFLAHVFCNIMGIPPLGWALQVWPDKKKCRSEGSFSLSLHDPFLSTDEWCQPSFPPTFRRHRVPSGPNFRTTTSSSSTTTPLTALYAAYLAGISTFIYGFWRWTAPTLLFSPGSVPATAAKWAYLAAVRS